MRNMIMNNLQRISEDYIPDESIFREYSDDVYWLKKAMQSLSDGDRIIFLLYCEFGSLRKTGKALGVSHSIVYQQIKRIRNLMYDYIKANSNSSNSMLLDRLVRICGDGEEVDMEVDNRKS